jgi:hypothetical protein
MLSFVQTGPQTSPRSALTSPCTAITRCALSSSASYAKGAGAAPLARDAASLARTIPWDLRKAGVQDTFNKERLAFERVESHGITYVQAVGDHSDAPGTTRRAAVPISPECGTVDRKLLKSTDVGRLFMVFCEPDREPQALPDGKL